MTLDQGNLQSYKRTACGPQPALHCGGVDLMNFWHPPWFSAETESLTLYTSSRHVMGFALGFAARVVTQLGRRRVGKPLTRTVRQHRHVGPHPGFALLSPFICLFCELLSFFPWRKEHRRIWQSVKTLLIHACFGSDIQHVERVKVLKS